MKIEFYEKESGTILINTDNEYFVMNNEVYCDNGDWSESQPGVVKFEDFIMKRPDVGWRTTT